MYCIWNENEMEERSLKPISQYQCKIKQQWERLNKKEYQINGAAKCLWQKETAQAKVFLCWISLLPLLVLPTTLIINYPLIKQRNGINKKDWGVGNKFEQHKLYRSRRDCGSTNLAAVSDFAVLRVLNVAGKPKSEEEFAVKWEGRESIDWRVESGEIAREAESSRLAE